MRITGGVPVLVVAVLVIAMGAVGCGVDGESAAPAATLGTAAPPASVLVDLATDDPLPFPGYEVDRVTIAPLPGVSVDDTVATLTGWAAFDDSIRRAVLDGGSDAVSVAVAVDGEIIHEAALGSRQPGADEPVGTDDRFRIASISKTITAITVLQLVEAGLVGLDEPVGGRVAASIGVSPSGGAAAVTVRQLLTHTSGFGQYEDLFFRHRADSCASAAASALARSPGGSGFRYSNMNFCVLDLLIEDLTDQPYEAVVYEQLLTPLGIAGMRIAPTYDPGPGEVEHRSVPGRNYMEVLGGAGAWVATPTDLITIYDSLDPDTPGWKPLEAETVAAMKTAVNSPASPDRGYGMGVILYGGGAAGHTGTVESTHAMVLDRADNITWAITVSGENPSESSRLAGIVDRALVSGGFLPEP
jgi:D-alanyl-D-alanine carboxypeptidase